MNKKVAAPGLENRRLTAVGTRCADHVTPLYPQKLALTSPTGGGRSVGIVRSRTKATEFSLGPCVVIYFYSKTNQMHNISNLFYFGNNTLHVSDGLSVHHQESTRKTVHTASGICHTGSVAAY